MQELIEQEQAIDGYNVTIKTATLITVVIVVVMTLVYCIRIYSSTKESVITKMQSESNLIEAIITDNLNYSKYFIYLISNVIREDISNLDLIADELGTIFKSDEFNKLFGWRKYSWINHNDYEIVTSIKGVIQYPSKKTFMENFRKNAGIVANKSPKEEKVFFYTSKGESIEDSALKIINMISDKKTGKYLGSTVLSYDIKSMIDSLNIRKTKNTNFIIADENFEVVAPSKPEIDQILKDGILSTKLVSFLKTFQKSDHSVDNDQSTYYLDMINGLNYHVYHLGDLPFYIIVNMDNNILKIEILDNIAKKLIEVSFIAILSLLLIGAVYRRETFLKNKAEKAYEEANQANIAKSRFLAFTAHEIRSPLAFILTGAEMLNKELLGPLPEVYKKYAEGINQNSYLILNFITDILDENQIIEGNFNIVNSVEDVTKIIDSAIKQNVTRYNKRQVNISTDFANYLPHLICDSRRMFQIISNIISNSIKYSHDPAEIKVKMAVENAQLVISISDNGIGMTPDEIDIALKTYGTITKSNVYSLESYGLGLPIVKMLMNSHDAKLEISSYPNKGTTVKMIFPKYKLIYKAKGRKNEKKESAN